MILKRQNNSILLCKVDEEGTFQSMCLVHAVVPRL
jgi:hypothetical protein